MSIRYRERCKYCNQSVASRLLCNDWYWLLGCVIGIRSVIRILSFPLAFQATGHVPRKHHYLFLLKVDHAVPFGQSPALSSYAFQCVYRTPVDRSIALWMSCLSRARIMIRNAFWLGLFEPGQTGNRLFPERRHTCRFYVRSLGQSGPAHPHGQISR